MLTRVRVTFEINEYEAAALLWDGLMQLYSHEDVTKSVSGNLPLGPMVIRLCIRAALRTRGQDSVNCGPIFECSDEAMAWCLEQTGKV